ncbi:thiol-disulfide isomerase/thioredoxin [Paenibacillus castaneae]|uniref:TlpA family protein disulfide reductase n=1 Tax=Paenibacillus castaneae TaxID=474957 RepID=UPI000C9C3B68|nr:TlpA disulfide reductase family protein [Paenibacillus castaneae]NIK80280.1 thiol-disulfide isomerase/thioredoxin [Paenibacillus castaneae]
MNRLSKYATGTILVLALGLVIYLGINYSIKLNEENSRIQLSELRGGAEVEVDFAEKPTVLSIFTSWCPYCNEDAPKMVALYEKYKDQINVYGINVTNRDELSEVQSYVEKHGIEYPVLLDQEGDVYKYYGGDGFPALCFVNTDGQIIDYIIGSVSQDDIEASFKKLLGSS